MPSNYQDLPFEVRILILQKAVESSKQDLHDRIRLKLETFINATLYERVQNISEDYSFKITLLGKQLARIEVDDDKVGYSSETTTLSWVYMDTGLWV